MMLELFEKPPLEDTLEHYGVKGMRWGVRRSSDSGPTRRERSATKAKTKLLEKSNAKAAEARAASRKNKKAIDDVKAKGEKSETFKALQEKAYVDAYNDSIRRGYGAFSATVNAGIMSAVYNKDSAIKELSQIKKGNDAAAKLWAGKAKNVSMVDVSKASKRDVKKAYRS